MSTAIATELTVEPILQYPRLAKVGTAFLLTVDLKPLQYGDTWAYPDIEEVPVRFIINAGTLFRVEFLGEPEAIVHRYGGTYSPARFLLTPEANSLGKSGKVRITLANRFGMPMTVLETDEIAVKQKVSAKSLIVMATRRLPPTIEWLDFEFEVVAISMDRSKFDVFLSHSIASRPQVKIIADKLKGRGLRPFLDEKQIALGDLFQERIQKTISQSKSVAVFIDSNGFGAWQATGLDRIIEQNDRQIPVIPVLLPSVDKIPDDLPPFLEQLKYVSFKNINDSLAMYHLEWGITGVKPPNMSQSLNNGIILEMESIPAGSFMMGAPKADKDSNDDERPQHKVSVPAFMMGKYPITQEQWRVVTTLPKVKTALEPDPSNFKGDNRPVEQVSWLDAVEFCRRLSNHIGREYRLPSEAEWEYACRAGITAAYSFGDNASQLVEYAWYSENSESQTHPVGQKQPNSFGLYDMHGNVWEWCADDWHDSYKGAPKDGSVWIKDNKKYEDRKSKKLLRGGSWFNNARNCRSTDRTNHFVRDLGSNIGFRVVCVLR